MMRKQTCQELTPRDCSPRKCRQLEMLLRFPVRMMPETFFCHQSRALALLTGWTFCVSRGFSWPRGSSSHCGSFGTALMVMLLHAGDIVEITSMSIASQTFSPRCSSRSSHRHFPDTQPVDQEHSNSVSCIVAHFHLASWSCAH